MHFHIQDSDSEIEWYKPLSSSALPPTLACGRILSKTLWRMHIKDISLALRDFSGIFIRKSVSKMVNFCLRDLSWKPDVSPERLTLDLFFFLFYKNRLRTWPRKKKRYMKQLKYFYNKKMYPSLERSTYYVMWKCCVFITVSQFIFGKAVYLCPRGKQHAPLLHQVPWIWRFKIVLCSTSLGFWQMLLAIGKL